MVQRTTHRRLVAARRREHTTALGESMPIKAGRYALLGTLLVIVLGATTMSPIPRADAASPVDIVILGGENAVSRSVQAQLETCTTGAVSRLAGSNRYETAAAISRSTFATAESAYAATGLNFPDALAGGPSAALNEQPVLLVGDAVPASTATELRRLGASSASVVGGPAVVPDSVVAALTGILPTNRIEGSDRYSTAAAIVQREFAAADTVYVATGLNFPDALAGVPAAANDRAPILLVGKDAIPPATAAQLKRLHPATIKILGGEAVISTGVAAGLRSYAPTVIRLSGSDRFATAAAISHHAFAAGASTIYIATGLNYPDALAGGPAAGADQAPILLVRPDAIPGATRAEIQRITGTPCEMPLPPTGNPDGTAPIPTEARAEDTARPDHIIGNGTPQSCTSAAVVTAVARGGIITFDCGPDPVTIGMSQTAKIVNNTGPDIVIDGGGLVTLSGMGQRRILYMNTCDPAQVWTTSHCQNQDHPRLTVQNLDFVDGNARDTEPDGGGAIFVRGGRFKVVNSRFFRNACDDAGPDVGGAAIRVLSQYNGQPVYVVNSTFGGAPGYGNVCSNGGGLSSIGVSWTVLNSLFTHNDAIGNGANPARSGTPGGGSGGAIYNDGNTFVLTLVGTRIAYNHANEGGGAIFFVSNDRSGELVINDSVLVSNPSDGFETRGYPGIFVLADGDPQVENSIIQG